MIFAKPSYLFLFLLLPIAGILYFYAQRMQAKALMELGEFKLIQRLIKNVNFQGRKLGTILWFLSISLVIISLARPQWGSEVREINQEGLQVMVALDISQSMLAQDIKPNRLERAKLEISDLMKKLNGDEIGLVLFSGASFIQVPLTSDYNSALTYLENAKPGVISRPGTVIGDAMRTAMQGFDPELPSQKVMLILTDGEDQETDPLDAAHEIADQDVLIYTIGFGTTGGEHVPVTDSNGQVIDWKHDQNGNIVLSKLDEETLRSIAKIGNGRYYQAGADGRELEKLLSEIDKLQKAQLENRYEVIHIERYQYFLGMALLLLVLAELIPDRRNSTSNNNNSLLNLVGSIDLKNQLLRDKTSLPNG